MTKDRSVGQGTRRGFLGALAGLTAIAGTSRATSSIASEAPPAKPDAPLTIPFRGKHQGGIVTPQQKHSVFAAFDLAAVKTPMVIALLKAWTQAADYLAGSAPDQPAGLDMAERIGLSCARMTITFGFGATLFRHDGADRFGLARQRPEALVDLPNFPGEQLIPERSGGDISVQVCADDPQVAFHALRQLTRLAEGTAQVRWLQTGFVSDYGSGQTSRNLMGFKDGTNNLAVTDAGAMNQYVWVGDEGPAWMRGGSYLVTRRARIALEHWERTPVSFQEQTFGRHKVSGAPLGKADEFDPVDLAAADADGNLIIPETAHVRLGREAFEAGHRILRRAYSYNDGANFIAERWPPWHQGIEFDAGLFFMSYQRDPRTGFIPLFTKMSRLDMMNQFVTNTGGGLFACPAGIADSEFIGQKLFEA